MTYGNLPKKSMDGTTQDSWKSSCPTIGLQVTGKQRLAYQHLQGNVLRNGKQKGGTKFPQGFTNEKKTLFVSKLQFKQVSKPEIINHLPHLKARPRHIIDLVHCDRLDATHPDMARSRR